jgi:CRISPR/Cas system-associated protein Cas5 (RAMP superfamily)
MYLKRQQNASLFNKYSEVFQIMTFSDTVEAIKNLSTDEKYEIQLLLKQYLREERREEIATNFSAAQVEQQQGKLKFSSNILDLQQMMEE